MISFHIKVLYTFIYIFRNQINASKLLLYINVNKILFKNMIKETGNAFN